MTLRFFTFATAFTMLVFAGPGWAQVVPVEGFGVATRGGAGQPDCVVTSPNDSGTGSLRECLAAGNRFVHFAVEEVVQLNEPIHVHSNVTIDGSSSFRRRHNPRRGRRPSHLGRQQRHRTRAARFRGRGVSLAERSRRHRKPAGPPGLATFYRGGRPQRGDRSRVHSRLRRWRHRHLGRSSGHHHPVVHHQYMEGSTWGSTSSSPTNARTDPDLHAPQHDDLQRSTGRL